MDSAKPKSRIAVCLLAAHPLALREMRRALPQDRFAVETRPLSLTPGLPARSLPKADVYVVDIEGPLAQTAPIIAEMVRQHPAASFLAIAEVFNETNTFPMLRLGIKGILEHAALDRQLVVAIDTVVAGGYWVPRIILSDFVSSILKTSPQPRLERSSVDLSRRETEVMNALLGNRSNKDIASDLNISERTVKFHVSNVLRKFHVRRRADLILLGVQRGSDAGMETPD